MSNAAMFTAITGTQAQQARIDIVANNLANLGTVGFKRIRPSFEDLFYETISSPSAEGGPPTGLQFGRGVRIVSTETRAHARLATRDEPAARPRDRGSRLLCRPAAQRGHRVHPQRVVPSRRGREPDDSRGVAAGSPITVPSDALQITITDDGRVNVLQPGSPIPTEVGQIQLSSFQNPGGLEAIGGNLLRETESSGTPTTGNPGEDAFGLVKQGNLEESNVSIAEELVNMIIAQRAFEANTRVISAADDMLRFVTQR